MAAPERAGARNKRKSASEEAILGKERSARGVTGSYVILENQ